MKCVRNANPSFSLKSHIAIGITACASMRSASLFDRKKMCSKLRTKAEIWLISVFFGSIDALETLNSKLSLESFNQILDDLLVVAIINHLPCNMQRVNLNKTLQIETEKLNRINLKQY